MRLHVYGTEGKILRAFSSKPFGSRQVAFIANFNMQIHSTAFKQENLSMKKRKQNIKTIIPFSSTSANHKAIVAKTTFRKPATNQHQVQKPSLVSQSAPSNFALYVITT